MLIHKHALCGAHTSTICFRNFSGLLTICIPNPFRCMLSSSCCLYRTASVSLSSVEASCSVAVSSFRRFCCMFSALMSVVAMMVGMNEHHVVVIGIHICKSCINCTNKKVYTHT